MRRIPFFVTIALILSGCSQFEEFDSRPSRTVEAPTVLKAACETAGSDTRTYIDGTKIHWTANDEVSYFPGVACNVKYRFEGESGAVDGTLVRVDDEAATGVELKCNYAIYPYNQATAITSNEEIAVELAATQYYAPASFGQGANLMVAATTNREDEALSFKNVGGYLELQLYGSDVKVKNITLKGNKDEKIAGAAILTAQNGQLPTLAMSSEATSTLTLDCSGYDGVMIGGDKSSPTSFWFVLPPITFSEGFAVTVNDVDGRSFTKSTPKSITIKRNIIQPMAPVEVDMAGAGLDIVGDKVRFYLSEKVDATRTATALPKRNWTTSSVTVNGVSYEIKSPEQNPYVEVAVAEDGIYKAVLQTLDSSDRYGSDPYTDIKLPYSQFQNRVAAVAASFPMYASYSPANGNKLIFNDGYALLRLKLKGAAKIASVRVENPAASVVAGISNADSESGAFTVTKGMDFAVLNCTNEGAFVPLNSATATDFYVMLAPGSYAEGLNVSICDSEHLAIFHTIPALTLEAGQVYTIEKNYSPDSSLLFYEGFDNFVWGGDYMKGTRGKGFAPDGTSITYSNGLNRTGYEDAFTQVNYNNPGTGFIQSNTWSEVSNKSVEASHQMPDSYVISRNIGEYRYMFRTQEHPGYVVVGAANNGRGMLRLPLLSKEKGIATVKVSFKFSIQPGYVSDGTLETNVIYGGYIASARLNGNTLSDDLTTYSSETAKTIIPRSRLAIPSNATIAKEWNTLELIVEGATDGSILNITDTSLTSGKHGIYIDSIEIREVESRWKKSPTTLRVLMWNIQNGMWADQHNNYDNFVEWVKKWDADVCIWCESETIYKDNSSTAQTESKRYLPNGWSELCKRYGHSYAYTGGNRDNYSQTVTAKMPITNVLRITNSNVSSKPITHGAGHCTVTFNGKKVNIVACHMWPQQYAYGVSGSTNQTESANKLEGDYYREFEMQYIVNQTVNKSSNANETLWLLGGDTNSRSPKDEWFYDPASVGSTKYLPHKYILENTNLKDVIADRFPSGTYFMTSTYGSNRIDILYASPEMFDRITNSVMLIDSWAHSMPVSEFVSGFHYPSDHRPVIVDFDMK